MPSEFKREVLLYAAYLLMIALAFVVVALLAAITTLSAPLRARLIADGVIYGCSVGALVSVVVAAWSGF